MVEHGCIGTVFHTPVEYSKLCGQVRGYQYSSLTVFYSYNTNNGLTINELYVDGVSIMGVHHASISGHNAGGAFDKPTDSVNFYSCPCKNDSIAITPPYVGTDYYCESVLMYVVHGIRSLLLTHCGMDSSVVVVRLPAAHDPTCRGLSIKELN